MTFSQVLTPEFQHSAHAGRHLDSNFYTHTKCYSDAWSTSAEHSTILCPRPHTSAHATAVIVLLDHQSTRAFIGLLKGNLKSYLPLLWY